jgi:cytoskeletal protein RodZ
MARPDHLVVHQLDEHREPAYQGVGEDLRLARLRGGRELKVIAEALRIRYPLLLAIEEGRFDDLPGPAYVSGFLRSYAENLELDPELIVDKYREEMIGFAAEPDLHFPEPPEQGRAPRAAVIGASLVVAVVGYGVWYFVQGQDNAGTRTVAEVPARMESAVPMERLAETPVPTLVVARPEPVTLEVVADVAPSDPAAEIADLAVAVPPADAPAETEPVPETPVTVAALSPELAPAPVDTEISSAAPSTAVAGVEASAIAEQESEVTPASESLTAIEVEPAPGISLPITGALAAAPEAPTLLDNPPRPPAASTAGYEPRTYGQENADARVVLRARLDAWVQIQGANSELILTRILHPGDTYRVPNRTDLTLITGNAGGLEVLVDGQIAPNLGPEGAVRRNISLAPESLISGVYAER